MYNKKKIESVTYTGDDLTTTTWAALLRWNPRRLSDAPTMLTTLRLPTGPVFGPTSEILVLLTPTEQHAHGRLSLETVWLFLLAITSNLVASSFHQLAGRCRQRRMSNFWLGDETAVPLCTLVPTSSLVRLSAAPNTEFVDLRLYDWCFLPEYQLDLFDSPPTCWVSTEAARPLQRHTWLACRSQRVQLLVRWWTARPKQAIERFCSTLSWRRNRTNVVSEARPRFSTLSWYANHVTSGLATVSRRSQFYFSPWSFRG